MRASHAPANLSAPGPVLVTLGDAAHHAKRPESTVRRWISEGRLGNYGTRKTGQMVDFNALMSLAATLKPGRSKVSESPDTLSA